MTPMTLIYNGCDLDLQTIKDSLTISAHAVSDLALLVLVAAFNSIFATTKDYKCL